MLFQDCMLSVSTRKSIGLPSTTHGASVSPDTLSHSVLLSPTPLILPFYVSWSIRSSWPVSLQYAHLSFWRRGLPLGRVCFLPPFLFSSSILGHQISLFQNGNNSGGKTLIKQTPQVKGDNSPGWPRGSQTPFNIHRSIWSQPMSFLDGTKSHQGHFLLPLFLCLFLAHMPRPYLPSPISMHSCPGGGWAHFILELNSL